MSAIKRKARPRPRNPKRKAREFARAYGSPERVAWIRAMSCLVCRDTPSENAHVTSGGMGRKADADTIVPLCARCHGELHRNGAKTFQDCYGINLAERARLIAEMWNAPTQEYCA